MKTYASLACLVVCSWSAAAHADMRVSFGDGPNEFTIEFVTIGNPGNPPDTTGEPNPAGAVDYVYHIGKYEVSRNMILSANAAGNLKITLASMSQYGGNGPNRPATGVSWNEAARFVNWLSAERGFPPAYRFALQPGEPGYDANANMLLWEPTDAGYDAANRFRNRFARYVLPSVDEWYKAAFYDPEANSGAGGYWNYPTGSDAAPVPVRDGTSPGTAVYSLRGLPPDPGPADITNAGGLSPYGVMGLGGNVWEWEETEYDLVNDASLYLRDARGGSWGGNQEEFTLSSRYRNGAEPTYDGHTLGFRVAYIPESSGWLLALLGALLLFKRRGALS